MRLIVDTNCIIAALLRDGGSRKIIFTKGIALLTPAYSIEEVTAHYRELLKKSGVEEEELGSIFLSLLRRIKVVQKQVYEPMLTEAVLLIDSKDAPFIALALAVENDGIWSEDKHFEQQNRVKVWKTNDLLKLFGQV